LLYLILTIRRFFGSSQTQFW